MQYSDYLDKTIVYGIIVLEVDIPCLKENLEDLKYSDEIELADLYEKYVNFRDDTNQYIEERDIVCDWSEHYLNPADSSTKIEVIQLLINELLKMEFYIDTENRVMFGFEAKDVTDITFTRNEALKLLSDGLRHCAVCQKLKNE